jgi:transcriptional regulator with XRE-family HTH domain
MELDQQMLATVLLGAAKARGVSMRQIARDIGVNSSDLHRITRTKNIDAPSLPVYIKVCRWLGVSLDTFITATEQGEQHEHRGGADHEPVQTPRQEH